MDSPTKKRLGATAALLFFSPALVASLSGCGGNNCDDNGSTPSRADDCGRGGRSGAGTYSRGGGGSFGSGQAAPRSGGFGGFGRFFSGGG